MKAAIDRGDRTTEDALGAYRTHLTEKGNKPDSIRQTCQLVGAFFHEPTALARLTPKLCEQLYADMRARPTSTGSPPSVDTHRSALSQVKTFLAWCVSRGWIATNPATDVKGIGKRRPRGKSLGKAGNELRVKEARAWYEEAIYRAHRGDQGAIAALVAMLLGLRASEIVAARVADLDEDQAPGDLLWIPCSKTPAGRRTLEVPAVLRPYLVAGAKGKAPERYLFEAEDGKPHWRDYVRKNIGRICDLAKVPRVTAHAMRGLLATLTAERGLAGHLIAATLGHEDSRVTMTAYARPGAAADGARRRGIDVLERGPLAN
jgi:integrase